MTMNTNKKEEVTSREVVVNFKDIAELQHLLQDAHMLLFNYDMDAIENEEHNPAFQCHQAVLDKISSSLFKLIRIVQSSHSVE